MAVVKTLSSFLRSKNTRDKKCTRTYIFYRSSKLFFIGTSLLLSFGMRCLPPVKLEHGYPSFIQYTALTAFL
ncbi:hypothetical protein JO41_03610 [Treponema sp. OMZ 838]|nr:hypothetical protein JO41_03610 [Treponema sp. OMZ 838]